MGEERHIGVVTFPIVRTGVVPLANLIDVLGSISPDIHLISGKDGYNLLKDRPRVKAINIDFPQCSSPVRKAFRYARTQFAIAASVAKVGRDVDTWVFFIGGPDQVIPVIIAKLLRRKICISFAGSSVRTSSSKGGLFNGVGAKVLGAFQFVTCSLADSIVVYSDRLIKDYDLERFRAKVSIAHEHYLPLMDFRVLVPLEKRGQTIGYVGRLSKEKGIMNLLEAAKMWSRDHPDLGLIIVGEGDLKGSIETSLQKMGETCPVRLLGQIAHDELPEVLNRCRLVVIPSFTEGLPNVMLEAMACGTPVLAAPVGSIPDLVQDEESGFLMLDNSPEQIYQNVVRALNSSHLSEISAHSRGIVESEFTYDRAVEQYRQILENI
jgi:glycosyltransferase involved in cell wall biosynthesis